MSTLRSVLAAATLLAAGAASAVPQSPAADWLWAAQTGPNLVTLTWQAVPGATEYQVYLGDPATPGTFLPRPLSRLGANARRASVTGMARVTNGIKLVARDAGNRVLREAEFNRITPATFFAPPTPTSSVTAQATGTAEITVTWDPVPGATAYVIGRSVPPGGFSMRCALCPAEPRFVDREVSPGLPHKYTVAAMFPSGQVSTRVVSGAVTPGATQVAAAPANTPSGNPGAVPTTSTPTYTPSGNPGAVPTTSTPTYPPPGQPAGAVPTTTTPTYTPPPGQPAGALPTSTTTVHQATPVTDTTAAAPTGSTAQQLGNMTGTLIGRLGDNLTGATAGTTTVHQATPVTDTTAAASTGSTIKGAAGTATELLGNIRDYLSDATSGLSPGSALPAAPTSVTATVSRPGAVRLTWQPSPAAGVTGYAVLRSLNGRMATELNRVSATTLSYEDAFFPSTLFAAGAVQVKYWVVATPAGSFRGAMSGDVTVQPPTAAGTPAPGGGPVASCRLDYQRADNMWAPYGTPSGQLGTESIALPAGQTKAFITDWKYEKQRNDGTNFFGSHLRVAANPTSSTIRLHLRSWTLTGLKIFSRTGTDTFWIRLDPSASQQFQADLLEVFCET